MALQRWRPDTCGCVIDVDFETRAVARTRRCPAHASVSVLDLFTVVHGENTRRARAHLALLSVPALTQKHSDGHDELRPQFAVEWSFTERRELVGRIANLTPQARAAVEAALERELGKGRVTLRA